MSNTAMITKSNPKQAIDLSIAPTKFGQKSSNILGVENFDEIALSLMVN